MKAKEVHAMKDEEIALEVKSLRGKIYDLRSQMVTEKVEDTSQFRKMRADVARLLTEATARQRGSEKPLAKKSEVPVESAPRSAPKKAAAPRKEPASKKSTKKEASKPAAATSTKAPRKSAKA